MNSAPHCRSILFTPALSVERYGKGQEAGADLSLVDLEDSVSPQCKAAARQSARSFFAAVSDRRRAVRINGLADPEGLRDLLELRTYAIRPDVIVIPKVESPRDLEIAEQVLGADYGGATFMAVVETARGIEQALAIAQASPRLEALVFGSADFALSIDAGLDWEPLRYARSRLIVAARAAGKYALDSAHFDIGDPAGLDLAAERAKALGFSGMAAIHPRQVAPIHQAFAPDAQTLDRARRIVQASDASAGGLCVVDGRMIGIPFMHAARRLLRETRRIHGNGTQSAPAIDVSGAPPAEAEVVGPRRHRNNEKMIQHGERVWQRTAESGLIGIQVDHESNNRLVVSGTGHTFMVLCSCSYLGLNRHPRILQGAIDAIREVRTTGLSLAEVRIRLNLLVRLEEGLRDLFGAPVLPGVSCSALTAGILPLVASGHLTDGKPRVMVFDRFCHFSMAYNKPSCADESLVLTCPHNDLDHLEALCKKYPRVAYVADGAYSMGGVTALEGLLQLQERYGLFLYFDDSHSLSIVGQRGEGTVRSRLEMNPLTIIVASLAKAFGTAGGIAMLGSQRMFEFLYRNAGPVAWSQNMEVPAIGASLASVELHRSPELGQLQAKLQRNIAQFDAAFPTHLAGNGLAVRKVEVGDEDLAVHLSTQLYRRGYYCSAVFFPIVPRGEAGVRIMMRADIEPDELQGFCDVAKELLSERAHG